MERTSTEVEWMDAQGWDERYAATELVWSAGPNQWVARHTESLPPGRALDLASGEGRNAIWLAERGWHVTGVDFSRVALDKAMRLAEGRGGVVTSRVAWVHEDVLAYRPSPDAFDLVLVVYLHVVEAQRGEVLRRAAVGLAPGGTLLVAGHHSRNLVDGVGGPQDPGVLYTEDDVTSDLAEFDDLHFDYAGEVARDVAGEARPALDVLVVGRRDSRDPLHSTASVRHTKRSDI